jgi:hypothetical protein
MIALKHGKLGHRCGRSAAAAEACRSIPKGWGEVLPGSRRSALFTVKRVTP